MQHQSLTVHLILLIASLVINPVAWSQTAPVVLPAKKAASQAPDEISPQKGQTDPLNKFGQPEGTKSVVDANQAVKEFVGVVQFLKGTAEWDATDRKDPIGFKSLFNWNESVVVGRSSHLKVITSNRCTGVIYGKSQLQSPLKTAESSWIVLGGSARWICGPTQNEAVRFDGHAIHLSDAEVLYHENLLYVIRGKVVSESGELAPGQTYKWKSNQWVVEFGPDDAYRSFALNRDLPAPKESLTLTEPIMKVRSRWSLGPFVGSGEITHPSPWARLTGAEVHGIRANVNFLWGAKSVLAGLTFQEMTDPSDGQRNFCCSSNPSLNHYSRMKSVIADLGWRSQHERDWGWYTRLGFAFDSLEIEAFSSGPPPNLKLDRELKYYGARLAVGIDKIFFEERFGWGGLLVAAEIFYHPQLTHSETETRSNENLPPNPPPEIRDLSREGDVAGLMIYLAPLLQF
ncbi:MAG: hypothetical protein IT288_08505 [Bdellovibrionales bacterium]|nr:hypothetical protein [Bdellovibrionales bacterium]